MGHQPFPVAVGHGGTVADPVVGEQNFACRKAVVQFHGEFPHLETSQGIGRTLKLARHGFTGGRSRTADDLHGGIAHERVVPFLAHASLPHHLVHQQEMDAEFAGLGEHGREIGTGESGGFIDQEEDGAFAVLSRSGEGIALHQRHYGTTEEFTYQRSQAGSIGIDEDGFARIHESRQIPRGGGVAEEIREGLQVEQTRHAGLQGELGGSQAWLGVKIEEEGSQGWVVDSALGKCHEVGIAGIVEKAFQIVKGNGSIPFLCHNEQHRKDGHQDRPHVGTQSHTSPPQNGTESCGQMLGEHLKPRERKPFALQVEGIQRRHPAPLETGRNHDHAGRFPSLGTAFQGAVPRLLS